MRQPPERRLFRTGPPVDVRADGGAGEGARRAPLDWASAFPARLVATVVTAVCAYALGAVAIRILSASASVAAICVIRTTGALVFALVLERLRADPASPRDAGRLLDHAPRAALHFVGSLAFVWSLAQLPLAIVASVDFLGPAMSALWLALAAGKRFTRGTTTGLVVMACGALVVLLTHAESLGPALLAPVVAVAALSLSNLEMQRLARRASATRLLMNLSVLQLPVYLLMSFIVIPGFGARGGALDWGEPAAVATAAAALVTTGIATQIAMSMASRVAAPIRFLALDTLRIPTVAIVAYFAFGQMPDLSTLLAGIVITAGAVLTAWTAPLATKDGPHAIDPTQAAREPV